MRERAFMQVDVFTAESLRGNPLAVVLDAEGLDEAGMQRFAAWTGLSETTFVLPPTPEAAAQGADYRLRIFTPVGELAFAGHPTLGSCHAWLAHGGQPRQADRLVQECAKGLVTIRRDGRRLAFAAPSLDRSAVDPQLLAQITAALDLRPEQVLASQHLHNGSPWLGVLLDSPETLLAIEPDFVRIRAAGQKLGLAAIYPSADNPALIGRSSQEAQAFAAHRQRQQAPQVQLEVRGLVDKTASEDPVTGSLNAALAQWLIAEQHLQAPYISNQGSCVGRDGWIYLSQDEQGQVWVAGDVSDCIRGQVRL